MGILPPEEVRQRANALRIQWFEDLQDALDAMGSDMSADARRAIGFIKAGNYSPEAVKRGVDFVLSRGDSTMRKYLAEQIAASASVADRVNAVYESWAAAGLPTPNAPITAAEAAGVAQGGAVPAQASVALEQNAPLTGRLVRVADPDGYPEKAKELLPKKQPRLSRRLHRMDQQREIRASVHKAVRESKALEKAARELIADVPSLGSGQKLPKVLKDVQSAARALGELSDETTRKQFARAYRRLVGYAQRIVDPETGTRALVDARGGYAEAIQTIREQGAKGVDRALTRWMDEKQRYNADRIVRTESAAAYRAREAEHMKTEKRLIGLIWRLSQGARRGYVARTKTRKSGKLRGSRCACEELAGETFPPTAAEEYPRMGHPFACAGGNGSIETP